MHVLFFDLDGVLIDSRPGIASCIQATLASVGLVRARDDELDAVIGPPLNEGFSRLLQERRADPGLVSACVDAFRARYGEVAIAGTVLQEGIAEILPRLRATAVLAIATSKPQRFADPIVTALGIRDNFKAVVGPTASTDGESKTQTLARAIATVETALSRSIAEDAKAFVGDRGHDVIAARAHGMFAIAATWGYGSEDELRGAGAQAIVHRPCDLLEVMY